MIPPTLPRPDEYQAAVQNPQVAFTDSELRSAKVDTNAWGLPIVASGGFAITYRLKSAQKEWAVRCFHKSVADLRDRYTAISAFLRQHQNGYFTQTEYQETGILVKGNYYPITKMAWIPGEPLNLYIERNLNQPALIQPLVDRFVAMVQQLEMLGISHGDLQHGNIMVVGGQLKLIDYDCMFVPALSGRNSNEKGHINYQHPSRTHAEFNAHLDRFSSIVIYLGLKAISSKPSLWMTYGAGGENLLFQYKDFIDPNGSRLLAELEQIPSIGWLIPFFRSLCCSDLSAIPKLSDFITGRYKTVLRPAKPTPPPTLIRRPYEVVSSDRTDVLLQKVGQRVEVVGKITNVYHGRTKTRPSRPYFFLNFGDFRNKSFRVEVWSKCLKLFSQGEADVYRYKDKWVSVTGVIGEFSGRPHVDLTMPSEIEVLSDMHEALERLKAAEPSPVTTQNPAMPVHPKSLKQPAPTIGTTSTHNQAGNLRKCKGVSSGKDSSSISKIPLKDRDKILNDIYGNFPATPTSPATASRIPPAKQPPTPSSPPPTHPAGAASSLPKPHHSPYAFKRRSWLQRLLDRLG